MDWANERFVRLFTRDTPEWLCWVWQARALWPHLIRKADRSGVIANKLGARGLAALVGLPVELVEAGLPDLLADGCLQPHQLGYVIPNYLEAQETPQSDKQRQRESRERRRVVTKRDGESRNVTDSHAASRGVTIGHSGPDLAEPGPEPEDQNSLSRAIPQSVPQSAPAPVPAVSPPAPAREDIAGTQAIAGDQLEASIARNYPDIPVTWTGRDVKPSNQPGETTLRANPPPAPVAFDPNEPRAIGRLAEATYRRVSEARIAIAAELKLPEPLPFPPITPATRTRGFGELSARIREEGALAPAACDRVVEHAVKQARAKRSIDWLGERLFGDKAWVNARDGIDPSARPAATPGRHDPQPAPPRPRIHDPPPAPIPRDQLAGPEQFAEARKLLAAVTSNDDETPDPDEKPRRKAAK